MPFGRIDHTPPILIIKQNPITRKNFCFFRNFFKKTIDKRPKTVYNIYCYLGVAQIGSALPWGGRGRRFKSCHSDQTTASRKRSGSLFYWRYMAYGVALRVRSRSFDFLHTFVVGNEYPYNFRAFLKFF